jgi:hypothetical protein
MLFKSICQVVSFGFLTLGLTACISNPTKDNKEGMERIENKVAFFLDCPKESLTMSCLNYSEQNDKICSEYGVQGCDNKVIYTKIGTTWIMTSSKTL